MLAGGSQELELNSDMHNIFQQCFNNTGATPPQASTASARDDAAAAIPTSHQAATGTSEAVDMAELAHSVQVTLLSS